MSDAIKLNTGEKHMLRLIIKGADKDGWAEVSKLVLPLIEKMPKKLVTLERIGDDGEGRVQLTTEGHSVINAMEWL